MNGIESAMMWDWITRQTIQVTLVAIAVLILVKLFARDRPHLAAALWAVVLLKSLMPPLIALPISPFSLHAMTFATLEIPPPFQPLTTGDVPSPPHPAELSNLKSRHSVSDLSVTNSHPFTQTVEATSPIEWTWRETILFAWLASSLAYLASIVFRLNRFLGRVRCAAINPNEDCVQSLSVRKRVIAAKVNLPAWRANRVRVAVIDSRVGPAVVGVLRPTILLPKILVDDSSDEELDLLLAHELIHIRRSDLVWAMLQTGSTCAWWFHPLLTWAARQFTQETEQSCDEETIACLGCHPHSYARVLLAILDKKHQLHVAPALPGVRPMDITMKRMDRIMRLGKSTTGFHLRNPWWCHGVLVLGALIAIPGAVWAVPQTPNAPTAPAADLKIADRVAGEKNQTQANDEISIETRFIRIPADALKELVVDWQLQESSNPTESISNSNQTPMLTVQLDSFSLHILLATVQEQATRNDIVPAFTIRPGQKATIKDAIQRHIVTGLRNSLQPKFSTYTEGRELTLSPERREANLSISCILKLSKCKDVGAFTDRTMSKDNDEAKTVQVPSLASLTFFSEAVDMPSGGSFVSATQCLGNSDEVALTVITLVTPEQAKLRKRLSKHSMQAASIRPSRYTVYTRIPILGPTTSGGTAIALDPPSDDQILRAVREIPNAEAWLQRQAENKYQTIRIIKEKIADYVDPPKFYPLIGNAQLHHAHYKCTLQGAVQANDLTVPKRGTEPESQVIYIDHNHFHMIGVPDKVLGED